MILELSLILEMVKTLTILKLKAGSNDPPKVSVSL